MPFVEAVAQSLAGARSLSRRSSVEAATASRPLAPGAPAPKVRGPAGIGKTALLAVGVMHCFFGPLAEVAG
jgi:hypothetical protein